eukprot:PhF_6_TR44226/c0_g2_i10/m.67966
MQHHWDTIRSKTQDAVRFVTLLLNIDFDEVGGPSQTFLPWDILDDLFEFIKGTSYLETHDGIEYDVPENIHKIHDMAMSLHVPFHMRLVLPELNLIPYSFGRNCSPLTTLNASGGLPNVTEIEANFLAGCNALRVINLSGLNRVTSVGPSFLGECKSLQSIDLSPLKNLTRLDNFFWGRCESLKSLDISCLESVTSIGNEFLFQAWSLESIKLSGLTRLCSIGESFLLQCKVSCLDFQGVTGVVIIGDEFLYGCESLTAL